MSSNYLVYEIPRFDITDERMSDLLSAASKSPLDPMDDRQEFMDTIRVAVERLSDMPDGLIVQSGSTWQTGGLSYGDYPNELAEAFDVLCCCPQTYELMELWSRQDYPQEKTVSRSVLKTALDGLLAAFPHADSIRDILAPIIREVRAELERTE